MARDHGTQAGRRRRPPPVEEVRDEEGRRREEGPRAAAKKSAPAKKAPAKKAPAKKAPGQEAGGEEGRAGHEGAGEEGSGEEGRRRRRRLPRRRRPRRRLPRRRPPRRRRQEGAAKKTPATKAAATKAPAKKAPAKKAGARQGAGEEDRREEGAPRRRQAVTKTAPATTATRRLPRRRRPAAAPKRLAVKADEKPWTQAELDEVRGELNQDRERLRSELNLAEHELHDLMRDAGDGAGNDQADVGSTTFERDHEMSLANNARDMLAQTERALHRIDERHLRRLRELRGADRQDAVDGVPACDTVPDMQAARGTSLNPSDTTSPHRPDAAVRVPARARSWRSRPSPSSGTSRTWSPRSWPSSTLTGPAPVPVVGDLLTALPRPQPRRRVQHRHVVHRRADLRGGGRGRRRAVDRRAGCAASAGRSGWAS